MVNLIQLLDQHHPSMRQDDEDRIWARVSLLMQPEGDVADLALRTCACGYAIDGFDSFFYHLKETIEANIT